MYMKQIRKKLIKIIIIVLCGVVLVVKALNITKTAGSIPAAP